MLISLIIAVLTYLLSPRNTSAERRQALVNGAAAGALTYGVTEYTDWGKENLGPINDSIGGVTAPANPTSVVPVPGAAAGNTGTGGIWDTLKAWGPAGVATVSAGAGIGIGAASGSSSWVPLALLGVGAFLLLKD